MKFGGVNFEENRALNKIDREQRLENSPAIIEAHLKAEKVFLSERIDMGDFSHNYSAEEIANDQKRVRDAKRTFEYNGSEVPAKVLEAIMFEQSELSEWLGPHAKTLLSSEFDDIVRGIDMIVEFNEPDAERSHLALGVDVTFGPTTVEKKFGRIKREIDSGTLASAKYVHPHEDKERAGLPQIPRVVIGIEPSTVSQLATLWNQGKKKELGMHPVQKLILTEIKKQLIVFSNYAAFKKQLSLREPYANALKLIDSILEAKSDIPLGEMGDDKVFKQILSNLDMFNTHAQAA